MKITLPQSLLAKITELVARVADKNHRFAILANIKLELTHDCLVATASDLEVELTCSIPLAADMCQEAGNITLPAQKFYEIAKSLKQDNVTLSTLADNKILIVSGNSRFTLATLPASDFPSTTIATSVHEVSIPASILHTMINATRFCMASQDVRHYLTGLLFHFNHHHFTAVATDGHRLAIARHELANSYDNVQIILPSKAVAELERLLGEFSKTHTEDNVTLGISDSHLTVSVNLQGTAPMTVNLKAQLIDGKFPDYGRVYPKTFQNTALFDKDSLLGAIKRVSILTSERSRGISLEFGADNQVTLRSEAQENGGAQEVLPVEYHGTPLTINISEGYLRAVIEKLSGQIKLELNDAYAPTRLTQTNDTQREYIVMPMRV